MSGISIVIGSRIEPANLPSRAIFGFVMLATSLVKSSSYLVVGSNFISFSCNALDDDVNSLQNCPDKIFL